jgi:hypothetical protein
MVYVWGVRGRQSHEGWEERIEPVVKCTRRSGASCMSSMQIIE